MSGTNTQLVVQNAGTFLEGGFIRFYDTAKLRVTGAGSVAHLDYGDNDGVENQGNGRIQVDNGGVLYVGPFNWTGGNTNSGFAGNWQGSSPTDYAITVDGPNSVVSTKGFQWMSGVTKGVLHATNGGALEMLASLKWDYSGQTHKSDLTHINIDGGGLSYKDCGATVNMNGNQTVTSDPGPDDFTFTGSNFFRLNNSTATDTGSYTLANSIGPKNYTRLEMVNGTTSVARDIIVDGANGGSILFDSTAASIAAGVSLSGTATLTANGTASTLTGVITGDGTLLKDGTGMLTLQSANIYSGDTLVQSGTLSIVSAYLADASNVKLDISGLGGTLNLNTSSAVDTIKKLYINGALQLAGLWGAIGSSAPHQSSFITGSGELSVTEGLITTVDGVWASNTVGNTLWSDAGNWTGGKPVARGDTATLGTGSVPVIDLAGTSQTVSALTFNNEGSAHYEIKDTIGGGSLMLWGTGSSPASVKVTTGSDAISANLVLASNLEVSGSGTLALSGSISGGTGFSLTMSGTNGTLILSGTGLYGGTIVNAGTLAVTTSTALPDNQSLTVGAGGTLIFDPSFHASAIQSASPTMSAVAPVPEPGTLALLLAAGLVGLGAWRRGKK